ncbi:unnamed protein product, partial [Hapterophycus canaliculatus]
GRTEGDWSGEFDGDTWAAVKLDAEGTPLWKWQDGTSSSDYTTGVAVAADGTIVVVGYTWGNWVTSLTDADVSDFAAFKLDADGALIWKWQGASSANDQLKGVQIVDAGGAFVVVGNSEGSFGGVSAGYHDFVAIKLDADGTELWSWQDGSTGNDFATSIATADDGSVILAGYTYGSLDGDLEGICDRAVVKLDANGTEVWRWQVR